MNFKSIFITLALASAASSAIADDITNLGTLSIPSSISYSNNNPTAVGANQYFYDSYFFTVAEGIFSSVTSAINLNSIIGLSELGARLYTGNTHITGPVSGSSSTIIEAWTTTPVNAAPGVDIFTTILAPAAPLAAGDYTLQIRGIVNQAGGSYAGVINVAAIPEPETYVMLLSGIALLGFASVRRKS